MEIRSLQLKNTLVDDLGEEYMDLSESSVVQSDSVQIKGIYVVDEETEMRPDLIALKFYGSGSYLDIICKSNNIFNPFSFERGTVLVIPGFGSEKEMLIKPKNVKETDLRTKFADTSRLSQKDQKRVERILAKGKDQKGGVSQTLPPNMLQPGTSGKIFKNGKIIFGANLNTDDAGTIIRNA